MLAKPSNLKRETNSYLLNQKQYNKMQPQKTSTTGGGTLHNIAEKIKHPFTHDTDTNITYQTREQKKLAETDPHLAQELGAKDVGVPPVTTNPLSSTRTTTTVPTKDAMLNQSSVPSTHSTISREEYHEKKW